MVTVAAGAAVTNNPDPKLALLFLTFAPQCVDPAHARQDTAWASKFGLDSVVRYRAMLAFYETLGHCVMPYSIGQLAKTAAVGVETIRFYERRGLMSDPPRSAGGYRRYPEHAAERLRFIRRAKRLGFSLDEIGTLLNLQDGGERAAVKAITQAKLAQIEARIDDLRRMRKTLADLEKQCSGRGPVKGCPIIEALGD